jgi:hypothetical protein
MQMVFGALMIVQDHLAGGVGFSHDDAVFGVNAVLPEAIYVRPAYDVDWKLSAIAWFKRRI